MQLTFEDWLKAIFAHPVSNLLSAMDIVLDEPDDEVGIKYLTKLFSEPEWLEQYLPAQVNCGLGFIIDPGCSNHMFALYNSSIPLEERLNCLNSIEILFEKYFAKHCTEHLSHLDEEGRSEVNRVCYMWWDIVPLYGHPEEAKKRVLDAPILEIMKKTLSLDSLACQESALHGLGHWQMYYPKEVEEIIDSYLQTPPRNANLQTYAQSARKGCVN